MWEVKFDENFNAHITEKYLAQVEADLNLHLQIPNQQLYPGHISGSDISVGVSGNSITFELHGSNDFTNPKTWRCKSFNTALVGSMALSERQTGRPYSISNLSRHATNKKRVVIGLWAKPTLVDLVNVFLFFGSVAYITLKNEKLKKTASKRTKKLFLIWLFLTVLIKSVAIWLSWVFDSWGYNY